MAKNIVLKNALGESVVYKNTGTVVLTDEKGESVHYIERPASGKPNAFVVKVVDFDGTVIDSQELYDGEVFTLPEPPTHEKLIFQEWSSPVEIIDNTVTVNNNDIIIGAIYKTKSGSTEFDIRLDESTGLTINLVFSSSMTGSKTIDWGDGNTLTKTDTSAVSHSYGSYGEYTITLSGAGFNYLAGSYQTHFFGQSSSARNKSVIRARIGENLIDLGDYGLQYCENLESITFHNAVKSIKGLSACVNLKALICPDSAINYNTITSLNGAKYIVYKSSNKSYNYATSSLFGHSTSIEYFVLPLDYTGQFRLSYAYRLKRIVVPPNMSLGQNAFNEAYSLESIKILNESSISIPVYCFEGCRYLREIVFGGNITAIQTSAFRYCSNLHYIDFTKNTEVPSLANTDVFSNKNELLKIYVPDNLYDEWITSTNWASLSKYIYKASQMPAE